jgi:hypothetical protein
VNDIGKLYSKLMYRLESIRPLVECEISSAILRRRGDINKSIFRVAK